MTSRDTLRVWDRLEVGPVRLEANRLRMPYRLGAEERCYTVRYHEAVFDPARAEDRHLAGLIGAQLALNYGLFAREIWFHDAFDGRDRRWLRAMADITAREIWVHKLKSPNPLLRLPPLPDRPGEALTTRLRFAGGPGPARHDIWDTDPDRALVLSSGGKESLLSLGMLEEMGVDAHPVFAAESGRHWYTALPAWRYLRDTRARATKVWLDCDRMYTWFLRQHPLVRPNFASIRADIYPLRLWTVPVFLFALLPLARKRRLGRLIVGDEFDTSQRGRAHGVRHYHALYDQSLWFDRELSALFVDRGWDVQVSSLLRTASELVIQRALCERYPELHAHQVSCHAAHIAGARVEPCGRCEKCRRIIALHVALKQDPSRIGYPASRVSKTLGALAEQGVKQLSSDAAHLAHLLVEGGHVPADSPFGRAARPHRGTDALRVDPVASPVDELPPAWRRAVLAILSAHAKAILTRVDRRWVPWAPAPLPDPSALAQINRVDHPFVREVRARVGDEYSSFDARYFDDPDAVTGFGGYHQGGSVAEGARDFAAEARRVAAVPGVRRVLDVGCAKGFLVRALREQGVEAYGIDISAYAIERADPAARPYVRVASVAELDEQERFDLVHVCGVLLYLELDALRAALDRLYRITRVGAIFDEPTQERLVALFERRDAGAVDLLRVQELPGAMWDALYAEAGFHRAGGWYRKVARGRANERCA